MTAIFRSQPGSPILTTELVCSSVKTIETVTHQPEFHSGEENEGAGRQIK